MVSRYWGAGQGQGGEGSSRPAGSGAAVSCISAPPRPPHPLPYRELSSIVPKPSSSSLPGPRNMVVLSGSPHHVLLVHPLAFSPYSSSLFYHPPCPLTPLSPLAPVLSPLPLPPLPCLPPSLPGCSWVIISLI